MHSPALLRAPFVVDLYRTKFAADRFRVVLTSDNAAFDFARAHRAELFPGVAHRLHGAERLRGRAAPRRDRDHRGRRGQRLPRHLRGGAAPPAETTSASCSRAWPTTPPSAATGPWCAPFSAGFRPDVSVEFPEYPDVDAAIEALRTLPADSAIVVMANMRPATGQGIDSQRVVELISAATSVPVFTAWDFMVGHGAVGGSVISGVEQGRLGGRDRGAHPPRRAPDSIPVHRGVGNTYLFDYRQLERFGIDAAQLPARGGGALLARADLPDPARGGLDRGRRPWGAAAGGDVALRLNVRRRQRAEAALRDANERFRAILRAATDYSVIGTDPRGPRRGLQRGFASSCWVTGPEEVHGQVGGRAAPRPRRGDGPRRGAGHRARTSRSSCGRARGARPRRASGPTCARTARAWRCR